MAKLTRLEKGDYEAALKQAFLKTDQDLRAGEHVLSRLQLDRLGFDE